MIERLRNNGERPTEPTDPGAATRPRLVLAWYLDPTTGKPTARWVREETPVGPRQKIPAAA